MQKINIFSRLQFSPDFKLLCTYRTIYSLAQGAMQLFLPIFLYEQFNFSISWVIVFWVVGYGLYGGLIPFGAMMMNVIGLKRAMILGRLFLIPFFLSFYYFSYNPVLYSALAIISLTLFRMLYWTPYHTSFIEFTDGRYRGRQLAWLYMLRYAVSVGAPLLGGLILAAYGFDVLFILSVVVIALSTIPLAGLTEVKAVFEYSYKKTIQELFKKKNRRQRVAYAGDGAQMLVRIVIWPIFIYEILQGNYLDVGAVTALVVVATVIAQLLTGAYTDTISKRRLIRVSSLVYAAGWIVKAFVATAFQIFIVGAVHRFSRIAVETPFRVRFYSLSADHGPYRDEQAVLYSMSINIGRVITGLLLIVLTGFFGLPIAFVVAAAASLLLTLL